MQISANLPGASPETMASAVATPLEVQLSSVPGITDMTSTSSLGSTNITLQFVLNKDIDVAAQEVQAAINAASGRLPADLPNLPTWRKVNPNDSPILVVRMQSDLMTLTELSDIAETVVATSVESDRWRRGDSHQWPAQTGDAHSSRAREAGRRSVSRWPICGRRFKRASVNQAKGALFGADRVSTLQTNDQIFHHARLRRPDRRVSRQRPRVPARCRECDLRRRERVRAGMAERQARHPLRHSSAAWREYRRDRRSHSRGVATIAGAAARQRGAGGHQRSHAHDSCVVA